MLAVDSPAASAVRPSDANDQTTASPATHHCDVSDSIEWQDRDTSVAAVRELAATSTHYRDAPEAFVAAIEEVLRVDVRSRDQNRRMTSAERVNRLVLDNASVEYVFRKAGGSSSGGDAHGDAHEDLHLRIASISAA